MRRITREEVYQTLGYENPIDFRSKRIKENLSEKGLDSECYGERQTGRSTRMLIDLCVNLINNDLRTVKRTYIVVCNNYNSLYGLKNKLMDILKEMKWDFTSTWDSIKRDGNCVVDFVTSQKMTAVDFMHSKNVNNTYFVFDHSLNDMIGI